MKAGYEHRRTRQGDVAVDDGIYLWEFNHWRLPLKRLCKYPSFIGLGSQIAGSYLTILRDERREVNTASNHIV